MLHTIVEQGRLVDNRSSIVLIDNRELLADCLLAGLSGADPMFRFTLFQHVDQWLAEQAHEQEALVVLCLTENEFDAATQGENKSIALLRANHPGIPFVIVSSREDPGSVLKALDLGAAGYIPTSMKLRVVAQVLRLVHAGGIFVPASSFMRNPQRRSFAQRPQVIDVGTLSPRQLVVARALRQGTPNKLIAYELNMCESTVKVHVRQIMKKLKAKNRTQIAFLTNEMFSLLDG